MMIIELLSEQVYSFLHFPLLKVDPSEFVIKEFWNQTSFLNLLMRFSFNLMFLILLVRGVYYPSQKRKDFLFAFITLGMVIFLMCHMLVGTNLDNGFALGLFAILGIIRYRTDAIPIKEMTYLFLAIGVSALNALSGENMSYAELIFANLVIIAASYGLEKIWLLKHEETKIITYEKIELVQSNNHVALHEDLESRTGIKINRFEIGKIDFLRDTATIIIYFYQDDQVVHTEA